MSQNISARDYGKISNRAVESLPHRPYERFGDMPCVASNHKQKTRLRLSPKTYYNALMSELELVCEKMIAGGDCLSHHEGKTVFVRGAIPGERVSVCIIEEKRDFLRAAVTRVLEASPKRIVPRCPYYGVCGGCNLQITDVTSQRALKVGIVRDSLLRAGLDADAIPPIDVVGGDEWEYRNRFRLHDGGLKERAGNKIVRLDDCPVAAPSIRDYLRAHPFVAGEDIQLFSGNNGVVSAVKTIGTGSSGNAKAAHSGKPRNANDKPRNAKQARCVFAGSVINEETKCTVNVCGKPITFDVQGFFQSNMAMLEQTVGLVTRNMGGARCADVYSGVGTFSVFLAEKFEELYLIEHNRNALLFAAVNLGFMNLTGKKHFDYGVSGAKWAALKEARLPFDAVVIDPPRSGMEKEVRAWLKESNTPQIRALSCDPVTFARDCADLCLGGGYVLESLTLLDYYPQTSHIETLANLVRA